GRGTDDGKKGAPGPVRLADPVPVVEKSEPKLIVKAAPALYPARELAKILDLSKLLVLPGTEFSEQSSARLRATAPGSIGDVAQYYVKSLEALGWKKFEPADGRPINDEYGSLYFTKDGHFANLDVSKVTANPKEPRTRFHLVFFGNLDTRT